jgi:hypothetical protein
MQFNRHKVAPANATTELCCRRCGTCNLVQPRQYKPPQASQWWTFIAVADAVIDADGKVLFSALKRKGNLELVGKAPLELRLGIPWCTE